MPISYILKQESTEILLTVTGKGGESHPVKSGASVCVAGVVILCFCCYKGSR